MNTDSGHYRLECHPCARTIGVPPVDGVPMLVLRRRAQDRVGRPGHRGCVVEWRWATLQNTRGGYPHTLKNRPPREPAA
jgi:hypothetical protein